MVVWDIMEESVKKPHNPNRKVNKKKPSNKKNVSCIFYCVYGYELLSFDYCDVCIKSSLMLLSILQELEDVERTSIFTKEENTTNPTPFDITSTNMSFTRSDMEGASMTTRP